MTPEGVEEIFRCALEARGDLIRLESRLRSMQPISSSSIVQVIQGGVSDPTADSANALLEGQEELHAIKDACLQKIARAKRLISGVREGLGLIYGDILDDYYIRGLTWEGIAKIYGLSKSTVRRKRYTAFDWIASVGIFRAEQGQWAESMHGEIWPQ